MLPRPPPETLDEFSAVPQGEQHTALYRRIDVVRTNHPLIQHAYRLDTSLAYYLEVTMIKVERSRGLSVIEEEKRESERGSGKAILVTRDAHRSFTEAVSAGRTA